MITEGEAAVNGDKAVVTVIVADTGDGRERRGTSGPFVVVGPGAVAAWAWS